MVKRVSMPSNSQRKVVHEQKIDFLFYLRKQDLKSYFLSKESIAEPNTPVL